MAKKLTKKDKAHIAKMRRMIRLFKGRIENGIAYLDGKFGRRAWLSKIDESKLDINNMYVCVTGQIFEDHWDGFLDLMNRTRPNEDSYEIAEGYGFALETRYEYAYDLLTRLWFNRISELKIEMGIALSVPPPVTNESA